MIRVEYRYPWGPERWRLFSAADSLMAALRLLDACRLEHPGSECRILSEKVAPGAAST